LHVLEPLVVGEITALLMKGLSSLLRRAKPLALNETSGTVRPDRWSAWIVVAVGAACVIGGALGLVSGYVPWPGALAAAFCGVLLAGFMAPSLTSLHAVHWNEIGIEGPCTTFGPTLGTRRTLIRWEEIVRAGKTATDYWYVESYDNRRVHWSFLYPGYGALVRAIRKHCTNMQLGSDLP
jgi:hypothetical protein